MRSPFNPLQKAIYEQLTTTQSLMAMVTGVFDVVPQGQIMPYVTIGETTSTDWSTKTNAGNEVTVLLHTWSVGDGKEETQRIQSEVLKAMTGDKMNLDDGFATSVPRLEMLDVLTDIDNRTQHGLIRLRFKIEEVS